jgi:hypothetical protein
MRNKDKGFSVSTTLYVSRLVMFYFSDHPYKKITDMPPVTYKDGDSFNVRIKNLAWTSHAIIVRKNYDRKKTPEPLMLHLDEIWKPLKTKNKVFKGLYKVSNYGRIKRTQRVIERESWKGNPYLTIIPEAITKARYIGKNLAVSLFFKDDEGVVHDATMYNAHAVAEAFIKNPKNLPSATVKDLDDRDNLHTSNIMWADQSFLSTRNMERNPHNRDNLKNANIKSGYYNSERLRDHIIGQQKKALETRRNLNGHGNNSN